LKSYDAGPISPPILEETIGENFERIVATNPDGEALVDVARDRRWTYAQLNAEIDVTARGLMSLGVQPGNRVGVWSPNCAEWTIVQYATAKIGAILVNINPAYRAQELEYVLNQSGVRTLVAATAFKSSDYRSMVDQVRPSAGMLREVVFIGTGDWTGLRDRAESMSLDTLQSRMAAVGNRGPANI
jgi:fatty-acyl-CoA synthase